MPPDNGAKEENLDMDIFDNFVTELSKFLGVEVVREDRDFWKTILKLKKTKQQYIYNI